MTVERSLIMCGGAATVATDPYFKQTTLLLHGDGTNGGQNNTFLDSSTNNFTITRNGNTTQGTFTPFSQAAGYWGNYFNGSTDYFDLPSNSAFTLGTGSFTIECWINPSSFSNYGPIFSISPTSGATAYGLTLRFAATGSSQFQLLVGDGSNYVINTTFSFGSISIGQWSHVALVRNGTALNVYVNGTSVYSTTDSTNLNGTYCRIGYLTSTYYWNGYISNLRVVKGTAVYTSAFTPSTTPLTAITNTSLLTCQSNRFVDNSANNFTLTPSGTPSVQPFSPFAPTAAYSTSVNGGSGYFDGTGDELIATGMSATSTSDYCIECFFYPLSSPVSTNNPIWGKWATGATNCLCRVDVGAQNINVWLAGVSVGAFGASTLRFNQWNHIAVVRTGGSTVAVFCNGVRAGTGTSSGSNVLSPLGIGSDTNGDYCTGYLSQFRVTVGSSPYSAGSSTITVPTAPLTAITDTKLLLSCTNAAIYDNAIKNDLETVGNAQISTSVKKYGTGSMAFDGTGDYLKSAFSAGLSLGSGDFTIEFWLYLNNTSQKYFIDYGPEATNRLSIFYGDGSNSVYGVCIYDGAYRGSASSGNAIPTATWTHAAIVRNSGTVTIYQNGTSIYSYSKTTDMTKAGTWWIASDDVGGSNLNGYIDDLRITKGVARYTANFTAPTSAFPNQ